MRDDETSSEWLHYTGECIVGQHVGRTLEMFPTTVMTWKAFRETYPDGTTIPLARQWWRRLSGKLVGSRKIRAVLPSLFRKTMSEHDARLPEGELGLGVFIGRKSLVSRTRPAGAKFYPLRSMRTAGLLHENVGGTDLVVFFDTTADTPAALIAAADGTPVDCQLRDDGKLIDRRSGSVFDTVGRGLAGPLQGTRMPLAPSVFTRWYGFAQTYRDCEIWQPVNVPTGT